MNVDDNLQNKPSPVDVERHISCKHYDQEYTCSFQKIEGNVGTIFFVDASDSFGIIFVTSGEVLHASKCDTINCERALHTGQMIFLDKEYKDYITFKTKGIIYHLEFQQPKKLCESFSMSTLKLFAPTEMAWAPLPILLPLQMVLNSLIYYTDFDLRCGLIMDAKLKEIFFVMSSFYTKDDLAVFFAPLLREEIEFKDFVINNHLSCSSVQEMADKKGISLRTFNKLFKETFDMPPYQWMLSQKGKVIKERLSNRGIPFSSIIEEFGFSTPSHFTVYCRKQFGQTPSRLRKQLLKYQK